MLPTEPKPLYLWNGHNYENNSTPQFQWALQALDSLDKHLLKDAHNILDLGCGIGDLAHTLTVLAPNASIVGLDISDTMITKAQEKYSSNRQLHFVVGDAHRLPYEYNNTFDYIISTNAFHWMRDKQAVWNSIARCLKPNGIVLVDTSAQSSEPEPILAIFTNVASRPEWQPYFKNNSFQSVNDELSLLDATQVKPMLKEAGLNLETLTEEITLTTEFKNISQFVDWLSPIAKTYADFRLLSNDHQTKFLTESVTAYNSLTFSIPHNVLIMAKLILR